jgi:hypothetical protein
MRRASLKTGIRIVRYSSFSIAHQPKLLLSVDASGVTCCFLVKNNIGFAFKLEVFFGRIADVVWPVACTLLNGLSIANSGVIIDGGTIAQEIPFKQRLFRARRTRCRRTGFTMH